MGSKSVRILVIGAGVNGSVCAARLHERGVNVTVLVRGRRIEEISEGGIIIEDRFSQRRTVTRIKVIGELLPNDAYDYVLVVVRRNQFRDLLPVLAANRSPNVVFMGNNLLGPREMIQLLGRQRVTMGFVFAGGRRDCNVIRAIGPTKLLASPFGEVEGTVTLRLKELVSILNRAGLRAISTNIVDCLATHASGVAVIGPIVMKYNNDFKALAKSAGDVRLTAAALHETFFVLQALGHKIVPGSQRLIAILPQFVIELLLSAKSAPLGTSSQAPDEMRALAMTSKKWLSNPACRSRRSEKFCIVSDDEPYPKSPTSTPRCGNLTASGVNGYHGIAREDT